MLGFFECRKVGDARRFNMSSEWDDTGELACDEIEFVLE